ncbi:MAG: hypothetical protein ACREBV_04775 [Candidatus Zixiibacteriota bacterium]
MTEKILKSFKLLVIAAVAISVVAAPTLQAFSFAGQFSQADSGCGCDCCKTEIEESACPVKSLLSAGSCPCQVKQQHPFNSKPIESSTPNLQGKDFAAQVTGCVDIIADLTIEPTHKVQYKSPLSKQPPLYILHSSFLI